MPIAPLRTVVRAAPPDDGARYGIGPKKLALYVVLECGHARPLPAPRRRKRAECMRCLRGQPVLEVLPAQPASSEAQLAPESYRVTARPVEHQSSTLPDHYFVLKVVPERCFYCRRTREEVAGVGCAARLGWMGTAKDAETGPTEEPLARTG